MKKKQLKKEVKSIADMLLSETDAIAKQYQDGFVTGQQALTRLVTEVLLRSTDLLTLVGDEGDNDEAKQSN